MSTDYQTSGGYDPTTEGIIANNELPVFLVVDTSGSMSDPVTGVGGTKIGQVNEGARRVLEFLKNDLNDPKTKPMFACLKFASSAEWVNQQNPYDEPVKFVWQDVVASGGTSFGEACKKLREVLTTKDKQGWLAGRKSCLKPVIVVMSDGQSGSYSTELKTLKERGWYEKAIKFGIAIGSDADKQMLIDFTGNSEYVYDTDQFSNTSLAEIIKIIVQQSSVVSTLATADNKDAQANAAQNITDTLLNGPPGLGDETP